MKLAANGNVTLQHVIVNRASDSGVATVTQPRLYCRIYPKFFLLKMISTSELIQKKKRVKAYR